MKTNISEDITNIFPVFKPIELKDREIFQKIFSNYQPETSELTFTNLFIWRAYYEIIWSIYLDWLLIVFSKSSSHKFGLPPIGPHSREKVTLLLLDWLKQNGEENPRLERVDLRLATKLSEIDDLNTEPIQDDFDYVYKSEDLILLKGRRYHTKRNYINTFNADYGNNFEYQDLTEQHLSGCQEMADRWCLNRRCEDDMSLLAELSAVREALKYFKVLSLKGGVVLLDSKIEAFTLGEMLNSTTAVIHIEKANPDIRGLYAVINQQFCEHSFSDVVFINREQDLGEPQLRQAKQSYYPDHMAPKYRIKLKKYDH